MEPTDLGRSHPSNYLYLNVLRTIEDLACPANTYCTCVAEATGFGSCTANHIGQRAHFQAGIGSLNRLISTTLAVCCGYTNSVDSLETAGTDTQIGHASHVCTRSFYAAIVLTSPSTRRVYLVCSCTGRYFDGTCSAARVSLQLAEPCGGVSLEAHFTETLADIGLCGTVGGRNAELPTRLASGRDFIFSTRTYVSTPLTVPAGISREPLTAEASDLAVGECNVAVSLVARVFAGQATPHRLILHALRRRSRVALTRGNTRAQLSGSSFKAVTTETALDARTTEGIVATGGVARVVAWIPARLEDFTPGIALVPTLVPLHTFAADPHISLPAEAARNALRNTDLLAGITLFVA